MGNTTSSDPSTVTGNIFTPSPAQQQDFRKEFIARKQNNMQCEVFSVPSERQLMKPEMPEFTVIEFMVDGEKHKYKVHDGQPDHVCIVNCPCMNSFEHMSEMMGGARKEDRNGRNRNEDNEGRQSRENRESNEKKKKDKKKTENHQSNRHSGQKKEEESEGSDNDSLSDDLEEVTELNLDEIPDSDDEEGGGIFAQNADMRRALSHLMETEDEERSSRNIYDDDDAVADAMHATEAKGNRLQYRDIHYNQKSRFARE